MSSRDIPTSLDALCFGWVRNIKKEVTLDKNLRTKKTIEEDNDNEETRKIKMKNLWPAFCSGAGLFSDGYVNNSIGTASTILSTLYPDDIGKSNAFSNIASIAFAGTVVGQLSFGYISDRVARKGGMMAANIILIVFTLLCAVGSWGKNGNPQGLFAALTTFRFFLGIGIGAEYPTSSVIASEFSNQLPSGKRNRYFIWFTNAMIDLGFVVSAFVPLVCLWIFSVHHLSVVWRLSLGLGAIPPISLFFMRLKLTDSESFKKNSMIKTKKVPYGLIFKFYWFRLSIVSLIWFIYDFSAYSFGIFSSTILLKVVKDSDMYKTFGWNVVFNLFYMPGAFLGAIFADYIGPRLCIALGTCLQGIIGFIMAGCYESLQKHVAAFVVVFGIFSTLGEFGPGDNIGALAAKTSSTAIRGTYYGIAAAIGKIGAFVGTWVFPVITKNCGEKAPFWVSSSLCLFSGMLALFLCPHVGQDAIEKEDREFIEYLEDNGYDTSQLGSGKVVYEVENEDDIDSAVKSKEQAITHEKSEDST